MPAEGTQCTSTSKCNCHLCWQCSIPGSTSRQTTAWQWPSLSQHPALLKVVLKSQAMLAARQQEAASGSFMKGIGAQMGNAAMPLHPSFHPAHGQTHKTRLLTKLTESQGNGKLRRSLSRLHLPLS